MTVRRLDTIHSRRLTSEIERTMRWPRRQRPLREENAASNSAQQRPCPPDIESVTEEELLKYGDELVEFLEARFPLQRNKEGIEVVNRF